MTAKIEGPFRMIFDCYIGEGQSRTACFRLGLGERMFINLANHGLDSEPFEKGNEVYFYLTKGTPRSLIYRLISGEKELYKRSQN